MEVKRKRTSPQNDGSALTFDKRNANKGTVRGRGMLEASFRNYGAGRAAVVSADGVILAGNKSVEVAQELGIPIQEIESDGKTLYVIRRTDLPYDDPRATELAIADNRVGQVSLEWDMDMLTSLADDGVDLSIFWFESEMESLAERQAERQAEDEHNDGAYEEPPIEETEQHPDKGELLKLVEVTIGEPRHEVSLGESWSVGRHVLHVCSVTTGFDQWSPGLTGPGVLFCPYPGPFVPMTVKAQNSRLIMVQPSLYLAGHLLDRYAEVYGEDKVTRVGE